MSPSKYCGNCGAPMDSNGKSLQQVKTNAPQIGSQVQPITPQYPVQASRAPKTFNFNVSENIFIAMHENLPQGCMPGDTVLIMDVGRLVDNDPSRPPKLKQWISNHPGHNVVFVSFNYKETFSDVYLRVQELYQMIGYGYQFVNLKVYYCDNYSTPMKFSSIN